MSLDFTPKDCPIVVTRRDNPPLVFKFKHPEGHENAGEAIDLTGNSYVLTLDTQEDGAGTELFSVPNANTPGPDGVVRFEPTVVDMTQNIGSYFYDLQETDGSGKVRTLVKGTFQFLPDIST